MQSAVLYLSTILGYLSIYIFCYLKLLLHDISEANIELFHYIDFKSLVTLQIRTNKQNK